MESLLLFGPSLARQFGSHIVCLMVLLIVFWLADPQCTDGSLLSHKRGFAPPMRQPFTRQVDRNQFRNDNLQVEGEFDTGSYGARAGATQADRAIHSRREMSITWSSRGGRSMQASAISINKTEPPYVEVEALVAFRAALTSDPSDALRSWIVVAAPGNDSNTCSGWVGVMCSPKFPYHVMALDLSSLQLEGSLNSVLPTLAHLPFLQSLDLSVNVFSGSIQGEFLTNFSHLSYFNVSQNVVTGAIPSEMGALVRLQSLDVSVNNMSGLIPESLANCSLLRYLNVQVNLIEGDIPASLGKLSGLEYLNMSTNSLSGSIPGALGNCSSLIYLNLNFNIEIQGTLPQEISLLKKLQELHLDEVYLSGVFPSWIGNLTSLTEFVLRFNIMHGEIPDSIGQLEFLYAFSVDTVPLTGVIPPSLCNLSSLGVLEITNTNNTGDIPREIGILPNLFWLDLQETQLTGVLPSSIANCSTLSVLAVGLNELMDPEPVPPWIESLTSLTVLYLDLMNLQGELPEIGKLYNLQYFEAARNDLTGTLAIGLQNCTYLSFVDLSDNSFTGEIPPELGELTYMETFAAQYNYLTGSFPDFISNWTFLSSLYLNNNNLTGLLDPYRKIGLLQQLSYISVAANELEGLIPETIDNCTSLQQFLVSGNLLSGPIPASLGNLTSLVDLELGSNNFQGPIPINLLTSNVLLNTLDLSANKLEGSIPLEIGQLVQVLTLYLNNNYFSGIVPSSLGNCSRLNVLDLGNNQFEGNIPATAILKTSASLTTLRLGGNLFSGPLPKEFGGLTNVQSINVSSNNLTGSIPLELGECVNLVSLDISLNNFSGQIPQVLGSLQHLEFFNASFNAFTGPIPQSGIFNSNRVTESSFLGNPGLCGSLATIGLHHLPCAAIPLNVSAHDHHCKGFTCKKVWIPITIVSTLILLGAVSTLVAIWSGWMFHKDDHPGTPVLQNFAVHVRLTERDVLQAMDDVSGDNVIGAGARSIVYKGTLPGGQMFALKKLLPNNESASHGVDNDDLLNEAKILAKLRHKNIVKCLGFYSDMNHRALVLEYMCGGCLHKHLHEEERCQLLWRTRLKVAMGVAEGMKYLHHDFPEALIHRDLKPSNIFLDADFEPKVGDFGISKFVGAERDGEATASTFCGTIGYMPPEYASQVWVSTKGDVYSYGIVVIELLTGRQPCSTNHEEVVDLRSWVLDHFHAKPLELLDTTLVQESDENIVAREQMMLLLRVSLFCTRDDPASRPSMVDVVGMLTSIINIGKEPAIRRSANEIVSEPSTWVTEDPAIEGAQFGSSF